MYIKEDIAVSELWDEETAQEKAAREKAIAEYPARLAAAKDAANAAAFAAAAAGKTPVLEAEDFCEPASLADLAACISGCGDADVLNEYVKNGWLWSVGDDAYYHF